jgi:DNA-binding protein YbaB
VTKSHGFISLRMDRHRYHVRVFDDESVTEALKRIDEWERSIVHRAEQAQLLARQTAEMSATARSRDGLVEVTVDAEGQMTRLHLEEETRQQSATATARTIMETTRAAKVELLKKFDEATAETVGADNETGRVLSTALRKRLGPVTDIPDDSDR